jgi:hypothetical protein
MILMTLKMKMTYNFTTIMHYSAKREKAGVEDCFGLWIGDIK